MDDISAPPSRKWITPVLGIAVIYFVVRLFDNSSSWSVTTPQQETQPAGDDLRAREAGIAYVQTILDSNMRDAQIQMLWRLIQVNQWHLPKDAQIGSAPELAKDLQTRAISFYEVSNLAQTASFNKILLTWTLRILTATGSGDSHIQSELGVTLAQISIQTLQQCPVILQHPEIRKLLLELRQRLADDSNLQFERILSPYLSGTPNSDPSLSPLTPMQKLFANRELLVAMLQAYMQGGGASGKTPPELRQLQLKSWLLICPLTSSLFSKSTEVMQASNKTQESLVKQIKGLEEIVPIQAATNPGTAPTATYSQPAPVASGQPAMAAPTPPVVYGVRTNQAAPAAPSPTPYQPAPSPMAPAYQAPAAAPGAYQPSPSVVPSVPSAPAAPYTPPVNYQSMPVRPAMPASVPQQTAPTYQPVQPQQVPQGDIPYVAP